VDGGWGKEKEKESQTNLSTIFDTEVGSNKQAPLKNVKNVEFILFSRH
jgi:hypothetical protein